MKDIIEQSNSEKLITSIQLVENQLQREMYKHHLTDKDYNKVLLQFDEFVTIFFKDVCQLEPTLGLRYPPYEGYLEWNNIEWLASFADNLMTWNDGKIYDLARQLNQDFIKYHNEKTRGGIKWTIKMKSQLRQGKARQRKTK